MNFNGIKRIALSTLTLSVGLGVQAKVPELKVGIFLPMSGGTATFGQDTFNGMKMAFDEINKAGKIKITYVLEDEKSEPTDAANAVKKLINVDKVNMILGSVASSNTNAAAPIAQAAGIPLMTSASTNVNVTKTGDFISRICFIDDFQGLAMAKFALDNLKAKTSAIVVDSSSDYSRGLAQAFKDAFTKNGGKIAVEVSYQQKDQDFSSQLTKVRVKNPDVIFAPGYYTEVANMIRQAKIQKIKAKFLGGDGWSSPELYKLAGDAIVGNYYSAHFSHEDSDPKVQEFVKKYTATYKNVPPSDMAALGYDAVKVAAASFEKTGFKNDPKALRDAINSTKAYAGVTGNITLDNMRNATKPLVILETQTNRDSFKMRVNP